MERHILYIDETLFFYYIICTVSSKQCRFPKYEIIKSKHHSLFCSKRHFEQWEASCELTVLLDKVNSLIHLSYENLHAQYCA
jgi:hypothetical protein